MAGIRINRSPSGDPVLASVYKLLKEVDDKIEECDARSISRWRVLDGVRSMLGQKSRQMDGVNYHEMRDFINYFMSKHDIR